MKYQVKAIRILEIYEEISAKSYEAAIVKMANKVKKQKWNIIRETITVYRPEDDGYF